MKTVGQILSAERKRKKWTLDEVQKFTKVHPSYIKAIEADDYSVFQGKVHAKGFLKIYIEFLELNNDEIMALWRRENDSDPKRNRKLPNTRARLLKKPSFKLPVIALTYRSVVVVSILFMVIVFFGYIVYQYQRFSTGPLLVVSEPADNYVSEVNFIDVKGKTEKGASLFVNNQELPVDEEGAFKVALKLTPGINTLTVFVKDKLGNTSEKTLTVVYKQNIRSVPMPVETLESTQTTPSINLTPQQE